MPGASGGGFASSSKLLDKKWKERQYRAHKEKMKMMKAGLNNESPKEYPHLSLRLKNVQRSEARQAQIDHENQLLLEKMTYIMKGKGSLDNWNEHHTRSLNHLPREREQERIASENLEIAKRLEQVKPQYDVKNWEDEYQHHSYLQNMWASTTKDYELSPRTGNQESDDASDEDDRDSNNSSRLPKIESRHENADSKKGPTGNKVTSVTKLPKLKSQKDAAAEQDAKMLFRACKGLDRMKLHVVDKPEDAVLRALIRKSRHQRVATAKKFEDLYDLNLGPELKSAMGSGFNTLIDCLLSNKEEADIQAIKQAIYKNNPSILVEIFCTQNPSVLSSINKSYKRKYDINLKEDIEARILDEECQHLLISLLTDGRPNNDKVDDRRAGKDAEELYEGGPDRYTDPEGKFMEVLESSSLAQIKAVFLKYKNMSGRTITDTMKEDGCTQDFTAAVKTLDGALVTSSTYWADQIHSMLKPNNPDLIKLLLAKEESQMPAIRVAYRKKYKEDLLDEILNKCSRQEATLVAQIAAKGVPASKQKAQPKKSTSRKPEPKNQTDSLQNTPMQKKNSGKSISTGPKQGRKGAVKSTKEFNVDDDVTKIHDAIQGWGTDEKPLIDILTCRSNAQRQQIKKKYKEKYNKHLQEELQSELSGDFEEVILALLMTPTEYDVHCLHNAVTGIGTNEGILIGILSTRNNKEMKAINSHYKTQHGATLSEVVRSDTSGDFNDLLQQLLKAERSQEDKVDNALAQEDAAKLWKDGKNAIDFKDETFKEVMAKRSKSQIKATFSEYMKISGQSIQDGIRNAMIGDAEDAYLALAKAVVEPVEFYALGLRESIDGAGTNDTMLIRIVVARSEIDLTDIKAKYQELSDRTLEESIQNECSGDYKKVLLALVKDKPSESDLETNREDPEDEDMEQSQDTAETNKSSVKKNVRRTEDSSEAGQQKPGQKNTKRQGDSQARQPVKSKNEEGAKKQTKTSEKNSKEDPPGNSTDDSEDEQPTPTYNAANKTPPKPLWVEYDRWWDTFGSKKGIYLFRPKGEPRKKRKVSSADDTAIRRQHMQTKSHNANNKKRSKSVGDSTSSGTKDKGNQDEDGKDPSSSGDGRIEGWKTPPNKGASNGKMNHSSERSARNSNDTHEHDENDDSESENIGDVSEKKDSSRKGRTKGDEKSDSHRKTDTNNSKDSRKTNPAQKSRISSIFRVYGVENKKKASDSDDKGRKKDPQTKTRTKNNEVKGKTKGSDIKKKDMDEKEKTKDAAQRGKKRDEEDKGKAKGSDSRRKGKDAEKKGESKGSVSGENDKLTVHKDGVNDPEERGKDMSDKEDMHNKEEVSKNKIPEKEDSFEDFYETGNTENPENKNKPENLEREGKINGSVDKDKTEDHEDKGNANESNNKDKSKEHEGEGKSEDSSDKSKSQDLEDKGKAKDSVDKGKHKEPDDKTKGKDDKEEHKDDKDKGQSKATFSNNSKENPNKDGNTKSKKNSEKKKSEDENSKKQGKDDAKTSKQNPNKDDNTKSKKDSEKKNSEDENSKKQGKDEKEKETKYKPASGKESKKDKDKKAKEEYYKSNPNYTYIPPPKAAGTIEGDPASDPNEDIRTLWKAMEGSGTNEAALVSLLTARSNKQRQVIRQLYKQTYNQDLLHALRIDLRGSFRDAVLALLMAPEEYDAYLLHEALGNLGTEQAAVNIIAGTRTAEELQEIQKAYEEIYEQDLKTDILVGPHLAYCTLLAAMLTAQREDTNYVDMKQAEQDAKRLANNGKPNLRPLDKPYKEVMTTKPFPHIKMVFKEYENLTGNHVIDDAHKVNEGDTDAEEAILSLAWIVEDPVAYLSHRLCGAVDDYGVDEATIMKIIVSRSEVDLVQIRQKFKDVYEQSLNDWLGTVCRGSTQDLLVALVKGQ